MAGPPAPAAPLSGVGRVIGAPPAPLRVAYGHADRGAKTGAARPPTATGRGGASITGGGAFLPTVATAITLTPRKAACPEDSPRAGRADPVREGEGA